MKKRLGLACLVTVVGAVTFAGTSSALKRDVAPSVPSVLPASGLPALALSQADSAEMNDLIGASLAERAGITSTSYDAIRVIGRTPLGTLYLVPGSSGQCLVIAQVAASCGDAADPRVRMLALVLQTTHGPLVGGGITTGDVRAAVAVTRRGRISVPVSHGRFILGEGSNLRSVVRFDVAG